MAQEVAGSSPVYHPIMYSPSKSDLWFGLFYFLRKTPYTKGICNFSASSDFSLWRMERGRRTAEICIQSPEILRCKRSHDLCRRKKITWSTLQCYVLLSPMEQTDSPPQIGVSSVGRNVIKVSHKVKKILWPLTGCKVQIAIATVCWLPKTILFCSKSIFCKAK